MIYKYSKLSLWDKLRLNLDLCLRVWGCWAGWWWVRVCPQFVFCLFNTVRNTAAPSTSGWRLEIWVRAHLPPLHLTQTSELLSAINPVTFALSLVYADPRYWQMELFPGRGQNIICDGSAF